MLTVIGSTIGFLGSIPCCFCLPNPYHIVEQGSVGLIAKFGKCNRTVDPGLYKINLMTESLQKVDIKLKVGDIPRQYVMTKDNVGINIDSVLCYQVVDPYVATYLVSNVHTTLIERTQTTLRHVVGMRTLQECIEHRDSVAAEIQKIIAGPAQQWGVMVESILIKDLQLSPDLLDSLAAAAKQRRIGESKIIQAEAEVTAASLMRKASDILSSEAAMQMRYLETLQSMSKNAGTKVIFMPLSQDSASTLKNLEILET
ncbi:hypothetical protein HMI55_001557 [Coelomomyces lativittatus]|nr:hypothetical protein HMI55_001557 [Coelomomyces lativittatus]